MKNLRIRNLFSNLLETNREIFLEEMNSSKNDLNSYNAMVLEIYKMDIGKRLY